MKKLNFSSEARKELLVGVNDASNMTKQTLGLLGNYILLRQVVQDSSGKRYPQWRYTKDGVSVIRDIFSDNQATDTGISMVRSACEATVNMAGDGTTVTSVLTQALMNSADAELDKERRAIYLKKGMEQACELVVSKLANIKVAIKDGDGNINHQLAKEVAMISANSDEEIGGIVADAIKSVTSDGMITVERSNDYKTSIDKVEGVLLSGTVVSPYFITNPEKATCEFDNPLVLLYDREISTIAQLKPIIGKILERQQKEQRPIPVVIVCQDCKNEALSFLVTNKLKGSLIVGVIKMSDTGVQKRKILEDLAIAVDGDFISEERGINLEKVTMDMLGSASKIIIDKTDTIIVTKKLDIDSEKSEKDYTHEEKRYVKNQANLKKHIAEIKQLMENEQNPDDKKLVQERYAKLTGGVAVIKVGGKTNEEVVEKIDRVDDALCASRSAIKEGIVIGGGSIYLKLSKFIDSMDADNDDVRAGQMLVKKALEEPFKQLLVNAGISDDSLLAGVRDSDINTGYNLATEKIENLRDAGVIDSAMVVRVALENAVSAAGLFIKCGGTIMPIR